MLIKIKNIPVGTKISYSSSTASFVKPMEKFIGKVINAQFDEEDENYYFAAGFYWHNSWAEVVKWDSESECQAAKVTHMARVPVHVSSSEIRMYEYT